MRVSRPLTWLYGCTLDVPREGGELVQMIEMKVEFEEPTTPTPAVVATTSDVTLSAFSWSPVVQSVKSVGAAMDPGDAGELAVKLYGPALERLADS